MDTSVVNASDDDTNNTMSPVTTDYDDGGGSIPSKPSCLMPLSYIELMTLAIAMSIMIATLILIPCNRRLRKQHHIFTYNLVLSDLSGAIAQACFDVIVFFNIKPPVEAYKILNIFLATSIMVSLLSIALVAGYQFITIRVDPFGSRNSITTPRLIMTCIVTWAFGFTCSSCIVVVDFDKIYIVTPSISWLITIATGLIYILIYRSVSRVPCGGKITQERKEENQRVLRTFGLIFGTTVLCLICPWIVWIRVSLGYYRDECLIDASDTMISVNWIANSIIYWWRLKEFRLIFGFCRKQRIDPLL